MSLRYIALRLAQVVPTCLGIVLVGFMLIHLAPGSPVTALAGDQGDADYYAFMTHKFGLDRPLPEQLTKYVGNVFSGDLGKSYTQGRPVVDVIRERVPATLLLTGTSLGLSVIVGLILGMVASSRPQGLRDLTVSTVSLGLYASPAFFLGQLAILIIALRWGWFPVQGMTTARVHSTGLAHAVDVARHLVLPASVLAASEVGAVARLTRAGLINELASDHIRTARAKGVGEVRVVMGHALRRALLPVVTVIGGRVGHLLSGAVVVEVVFGWPGIGRLLLSSMQSRDIPIVLGVFLFVAFTVVIANLLSDLVYAWLDPRVRYR